MQDPIGGMPQTLGLGMFGFGGGGEGASSEGESRQNGTRLRQHPKLGMLRPSESTIDGFVGAKHIGIFGSIALTVNNISGAGMLELPALAQSAGWAPLVAMVLVCWFTSTLCATFLADAVSRIPGNARFEQRVEYSTAFQYFLGRRWFLVTQVTYFLSLFLQNVAAIVSTAQVVDSLVANCIAGGAYGYQIYPHPGAVVWAPPHACQSEKIQDAGICVPFGDMPEETLLVTLGYVVSLIVLLPLGLMRLEDNSATQILSFAVLMACCVQFVLGFMWKGLEPDRLPALGEDSTHLVGTVLFNFAFAVTIPAWLNEKAHSVSVTQSIWWSSSLSTFIFIGVAVLGAMAYPDIPDDLLQALASKASDRATQIFGGLFGFFIIGFGIPVFCVLLRYNLVVDGVAGPRTAMFLGALLPWLVSWPLYQGHELINMLSVTGVYLNGFTGFIAPAWLSLAAVRASRRRREREERSEEAFHLLGGTAAEESYGAIVDVEDRTYDGTAAPKEALALPHGSVRPLPLWLEDKEVGVMTGLFALLVCLIAYAACAPVLPLLPGQV